MLIHLFTVDGEKIPFDKEHLFRLADLKKRNRERDELCILEDSLVKEHKITMWHLGEDYDFTSEKIHFLFTIPYSEREEDFEKVKLLWSGCDGPKCNLPNGYLRAKVVFVGEAPGWHENNDLFGARIYTFGRTSLLFRLLSSKIFGKCWYTNVSKNAVKQNLKLVYKELRTHIETLKQELSLMNPENIICLGNYVFDILSEAGLERLHKIYHPAYIFRNGNDNKLYEENMNKTLEEMKKNGGQTLQTL